MVQKLKTLFPVILVIIVLAAGMFFLAKKNDAKLNTSSSLPTSYEYYWGNGCPHCLIVGQFLDSWENKDKIVIDKKEVWNDQTNYLQMQKRAEYCKLDKNQLGVPLLFTPEGKCFIGDQPIIDFFKSLTF